MADAQRMLQDISMEGLKAAPPVTVYALTLNEWLAAVTIAYVVLQAAYLLWKWAREWRSKRSSVPLESAKP